jgi:exodeoxyribonuclease VII large subunit
VRAATPSQAAELVVPDARAQRAALARQRLSLLRAVSSRLELERSRLGHLRASLGDPRFILIERQQELDELRDRLARRVGRALQTERARVSLLERRLAGRHPRSVIESARAELGPLRVRLEAAQARRLRAAGARLREQAASLDALSPLTVLGRGYAIATRSDGRALRSADEIALGSDVSVRLARGRFAARVTQVTAPETPEASDTGGAQSPTTRETP